MTVAVQRRFLEKLKAGYSVSSAVEELNVSRTQVYELRKADRDFRLAWERAWRIGQKAVPPPVVDFAAQREAREAVQAEIVRCYRASVELEPELDPGWEDESRARMRAGQGATMLDLVHMMRLQGFDPVTGLQDQATLLRYIGRWEHPLLRAEQTAEPAAVPKSGG